MLTLDGKPGESFFIGLASEKFHGMTVGELLDKQALEIKIMDVSAGGVKLSFDTPDEISIICSDISGKVHGSDFPPHQPIQQGD